MTVPLGYTPQQVLAAQARARRGNVRRLAEVRGLSGGHRAPARDVRLRAADGTLLAASLLPGPRRDVPAVVVAHGFAAHRRKPAYALAADVLAGFVHVLTLDLRGHGQSGGQSTFGDLERLDVAAALRAVRGAGFGPVVAVGLSMGGTAVLHTLAEEPLADAAVTISAPAYVGAARTEPVERLYRLCRSPWQRHGFRVLTGVRLAPPERTTTPPHPRDLAAKIDVPLLVVHGEDDAFFPLSDAEDIAAAAGGPATLWREPAGFGHAEEGMLPGFAARLGAGVLAAASEGRFPDRVSRPALRGR